MKEKIEIQRPISAKDYLELFEVSPADNRSDFVESLKDLDAIWGSKVVSAIYNRGEGRIDDDGSFYALKNESMEKALRVSMSVSGNYYLDLLSYFERHSELFGKRILDVGCDDGIITCFVALNHPDSEVVGFTNTPEAIAAAKDLADRLHLENVEFRCCDIKDFGEGEFDTIISARFMTAYMKSIDIDAAAFFVMDSVERNLAVIEDFYPDFVIDHLSDTGKFISVERYLSDNGCINIAQYLSWLCKLGSKGLAYDKKYIESVQSEEVQEKFPLMFIVCNKSNGAICSSIDILKDLYDCEKYESEHAYVMGQADVAFYKLRNQCISGYRFYDNNSLSIQIGIWKTNDKRYILYFHNRCESSLYITADKSIVETEMEGMSTELLDIGLEAYKLKKLPDHAYGKSLGKRVFHINNPKN